MLSAIKLSLLYVTAWWMQSVPCLVQCYPSMEVQKILWIPTSGCPCCLYLAWNPWALFFRYLWTVFWGYSLPEFILPLFPVQSSNRNGASSSSIHGKPALMSNLIILSPISNLQLQSRCCSGGHNKSWIPFHVISFLCSEKWKGGVEVELLPLSQ